MSVPASPQLLRLPSPQRGGGITQFLVSLTIVLLMAFAAYWVLFSDQNSPFQDSFNSVQLPQDGVDSGPGSINAIDEQSLTPEQLMTLKPIQSSAPTHGNGTAQGQELLDGAVVDGSQKSLSGSIVRGTGLQGSGSINGAMNNGVTNNETINKASGSGSTTRSIQAVNGSAVAGQLAGNSAGSEDTGRGVNSISGTIVRSGNADPSLYSGLSLSTPSADTTLASRLTADSRFPIPPLNNSDSTVKQSLMSLDATLMLANWLVDEELVRKFVVMVDNMAEGQIPRKHIVLKPLPTTFRVLEKGDQVFLDGYNFGRYRPYIDLLTRLDAQRVTSLYLRYYPLMQQAYAELGYPRRSFHKRLLMAIDHMLDSPVMDGAIELVQPSVMYKYADPELEQLSDVHKQLLRMGPENARQILTRLTALRSTLLQFRHG
ncbi:DUF3014 domain-containing protein [Motiliproteus sp. MSK22-1]|uniref:DUF3014 domain-containing protein n=1 Tax=Motiliproteus sp. MSK22-1 TaxID=1897630 RepID=UPI0009771F71|nr:DUF3014 domain-containing protein [Motiliproteus sp. MSK22-1]OMH30277.1 hypothetical protein BGP75_17955 [Motiliproteus sp. MSK22-1]